MNDMDALTKYLKIVTDVLFVKNPVATSLGVLFGIIIHGIFGFLLPIIQSYDSVKVTALNIGHFIAVGIFFFNIKGYLGRHKISKEIEVAFAFIKKQESDGAISEIEAKRQYKALITSAVERAKFKNKASATHQK